MVVNQNRFLTNLLISLITAMIITGIIVDGTTNSFSSFLRLQIHPARLINDFILIEGIGATFINAALTGTVGLITLKLAGVSLSGATFAAIFTMIGFGLFGKTPVNCIPIMLGVFFAAKVAGKEYKQYIIIALFGTALGPLVTVFLAEFGFATSLAIPVGIMSGITIGFILPAIAVSMLHLHQGYNLYNMGLTCGFLGLFGASFMRSFKHDLTSPMMWYNETSLVLQLTIPVISIALILSGIIISNKSLFKEWKEILAEPGRLPSDFMDIASMPAALFNAGTIGLIGSLYVYVSGSDFNGPVLGGLFTIMGFGAFGTHAKNALPVMAGVVIACFLYGLPLNSPGPILAVLFVTTLGPIAGQFGVFLGTIAGFIHLSLVMYTGSWHGGMNLYNNGFAGGLTAALIVAIVQWWTSNHSGFHGKKY